MTQDKGFTAEQIASEQFAGDPTNPEVQQKKGEFEDRGIEAIKGNVAYLMVAIKPRPDGELEVITSVAGELHHLPLLSLGVMSLMAKIQATQEAVMEREASSVPPSKMN